jgi:hypothetical protein
VFDLPLWELQHTFGERITLGCGCRFARHFSLNLGRRKWRPFLVPTSGRNLVSTPAHEAISQPRIDLAKKTPPHLRDKARFSSGRLSPSRPGQSRLASERGEIGAQVHFKDGRPRNPARRLTMKHALMSAVDTV